jgi:hypothetical protein
MMIIRDIAWWVIAQIAICTGTITIVTVVVTLPPVYAWLSTLLRVPVQPVSSAPGDGPIFVPPILTVRRVQRGTVIGGAVVGAAWIGIQIWLSWHPTRWILPLTVVETILLVTMGCAVGALGPILIAATRYRAAIESALPKVIVAVTDAFAYDPASLLETMVRVAKQTLPPSHPLLIEWSWMYRHVATEPWTTYDACLALAKTTPSVLHRNILIALAQIVGDIRARIISDQQTITAGLKMLAAGLEESEDIRAAITNETNQVRGTGYAITAITGGLALYLAIGQWERYATAFFTDVGSILVWGVFLVCIIAPAVGARWLTRVRIAVF